MTIRFSSKQEIIDKLRSQIEAKDSTAVHALMFIYDKQNEDEKHYEDVKHRNGVGFKPQDAKRWSAFAKWYLNKGFLTSKQIAYVKKMTAKYASQIVNLKIIDGEIRQLKRGEWVWH